MFFTIKILCQELESLLKIINLTNFTKITLNMNQKEKGNEKNKIKLSG
tara:strand:- start:417 stop:560 length:144 start_codon:yes stop_codon:yes gene_type:complete